jgi:hypothetical protein
MKIKTITCHDVYNLGASLQAYALAAYLKNLGHDVQIIDYKPDYLSRHYSLTAVPNPRFDRPVLRELYLLAKLPGRMKARRSLRKQRFDAFRMEQLPLTERRYESAEELRADCPKADFYIAGSDQIWNPVFPNGKDPAFFLEFAPEDKQKISYAASFSVDELSETDSKRMQPWLKRLNAISVREVSGLSLLESMGVSGIQVMDPVFLLEKAHWERMAILPAQRDYILIYDFDNSARMRSIASALARQTGKKIISVFPLDGADEVWANMGPREFLGAIMNAGIVLSNSFHATAFSLIFQKEFYVINREEKINTRMRDLLASVFLSDRLLSEAPGEISSIDWSCAKDPLDHLIAESKAFLCHNIQ